MNEGAIRTKSTTPFSPDIAIARNIRRSQDSPCFDEVDYDSDVQSGDGEEPDYLERLDAFFDGTEQTTLYFELEKRQSAPDLSDGLSDEEVLRALTGLVWSLGELHVYIEDTDHLSDRELYRQLKDYCDEPTPRIMGIPDAATHWSPIGGCSEEDFQIWLRYYATAEERIDHAEKYPTDPMPSSELPPYPRPWLPVRNYSDSQDYREG